MDKRCTKCGEEKDIEQFNRHAHTRDGRRSECKQCVAKYRADNADALSERNRAYYAANADRARSRRLRRQFGITVEQYDAMLSEQGGNCAVCGEPCATGRRLAVDHDHATGKIRALLCQRCNLVLGKLQDDRVLARNLADYLDDHTPWDL